MEPVVASQPVYIARQPIFDAANARVAYELLYRSSASATAANLQTHDQMGSDSALHAVVSIGLDRLTGGATAFINVTREHLLGALYKVFDPSTVVLELLESIEADPEIIEACAKAAADGYRLALDDYDARPSLDPLLPYVTIIKLDVLHTTADALAPVVQRLRGRGLTVLAERVETPAVRDAFAALGCALFQGYLYSKPQTLDGRAITVQQSIMINIMGLLGDASVNDLTLEDAFRTHPTLSVALLRIVNSASFGARSVDSIGQAIRLVGRAALSRWLMVMLVSSVSAQSPVAQEVTLQALIRARFCELVTVHDGSGDPGARFLVGLLSRIDVLLGQSMAHVLERLPVAHDVREALLQQTGPHADVLALACAYESGDWDAVDRHTGRELDKVAALTAIYSEAAEWANKRLTVAAV